VLDGLVHGSFGRVARLVKGSTEKALITDYLRRRDAWLRGSARLRKTAYRTRFFLGEVAKGNWQLELPLTVNGRKLSAEDLAEDREAADFPPKSLPETTDTEPQFSAKELPADEPRPSILGAAEAAFDQVDDCRDGDRDAHRQSEIAVGDSCRNALADALGRRRIFCGRAA